MQRSWPDSSHAVPLLPRGDAAGAHSPPPPPPRESEHEGEDDASPPLGSGTWSLPQQGEDLLSDVLETPWVSERASAKSARLGSGAAGDDDGDDAQADEDSPRTRPWHEAGHASDSAAEDERSEIEIGALGVALLVAGMVPPLQENSPRRRWWLLFLALALSNLAYRLLRYSYSGDA
jgi:hypothetical protein